MEKPKALVTGYKGLIGRSTVKRLIKEGFYVVGLDNSSREKFFGKDGRSEGLFDAEFMGMDLDIATNDIFETIGSRDFDVVVHCAAQPSHELANTDPKLDFQANVVGTHNLMEYVRDHSPKATVIHLSTTKVYSDVINETTAAVGDSTEGHLINEAKPIQGNHGMFGAHKLAADIIVQEYGNYYGMNTIIFRPGCITGKNHAGTRQHGFLSYLARCFAEGRKYNIEGDGKQVRDQLHVEDLVSAFMEVIKKPKRNVYVIGGEVGNSISVLDAIKMFQDLTGKTIEYDFVKGRDFDHKFNVHIGTKFRADYPNWKIEHNLLQIFKDLI